MLKQLKKHTPILVSVLFAVAAAVLVYFTINTWNATVPVVVAKNNLSIGKKITPGDVQVKDIPRVAVPGTAFRSVGDVVGKTVVGGPILRGDIVRSEHLSSDGALTAALRSFAPGGRVAVELPAGTGTGMAGIRRGDTVDVYGGSPNGQGVTATLVAKDAVVLATPWVTADANQGKGESLYVLAVRPEEAEAIANLIVTGQKASIVLKRGHNR